MIRHPLVPAVTVLTALAVVSGCTSGGSTSTPTTRASSPSAPGTVTGTAPTAPTSAAATCSASSTALTYRRHTTVVEGTQFGLAPDSRLTTPLHLPVVEVVRAKAPGLGTGAGLTAAVGRHWHTLAAGLGSTAVHRDGSRVGLHDRSKRNETYAVYRFVHVLTGQYSSRCDGAQVTGSYTTFGPESTVVVSCGAKVLGKLDRLGQQFCS